MGRTILEVVYIRLYFDTGHSIDRRFIAFMKCKLHIGFAELILLVAQRGPWMKNRRRGLGLELFLIGGKLDLMDQLDVGIAEEPILRHLVPDNPLEILEGVSHRKMDLPHCCDEV